jgi:hypothetical protein
VPLCLFNYAERVKFYHAAKGSPPTETLLKAMREELLPTLPITITTSMLNKSPPRTLVIVMAKGHLDVLRQGTSTQSEHSDQDCRRRRLLISSLDPSSTPHQEIYCAKDEIDVDPTGRLPIHTEWGGSFIYCCIFIQCFTSNCIGSIADLPTQRLIMIIIIISGAFNKLYYSIAYGDAS